MLSTKGIGVGGIRNTAGALFGMLGFLDESGGMDEGMGLDVVGKSSSILSIDNGACQTV